MNKEIKHGFIPKRVKDHRRYSFHKTFGSASLASLNVEVNYDNGVTVPDQNADGKPYGCTGYTQSELATDFDGVVYQPGFTYEKTCEIEGHGMDRGCQIGNSFKSGRVYGMQMTTETTDNEALSHLRGQDFEVDQADGYDWFDSMRSALVQNLKRSISIGTPWFPNFNDALYTRTDGLMPSPDDSDPSTLSWHNWKICGQTQINGVWYLIGKTWQGKEVGKGGFSFWSREAINVLMSISRTEAATQAKATPEEIQTVSLGILGQILSRISNVLNLMLQQVSFFPSHGQ